MEMGFWRWRYIDTESFLLYEINAVWQKLFQSGGRPGEGLLYFSLDQELVPSCFCCCCDN